MRLRIIQTIRMEEAIAKCERDGEGRKYTVAYLADKADCTDEEAEEYLSKKEARQMNRGVVKA
jgi:hypothetical protein